ncbi:HAUS augmin-like complex subunit 6 [Brachionichthys hirsutus]|uniref:HAUS augmin-like complex subunit 6 n=1 Tax=Brachionichthys hirsutus TaxID=412623 RepID=UPI0036053C42
MANPAAMQRENGKHLWYSLLGLGFQPNNAKSSMAAGRKNVNVKHIHLGPNMFDKPNKDAFYIVTHFLLEKLNPARFSEAYRHCWPVLGHKDDAEFRKVTCAWLRDIVDESSRSGSKAVASLFLSPGGPKFVNLMLNLANHVMLQDMKTFTADDGWVPEAAALPASSLDMAAKRLDLVTARFLRTAADQDRFLQDYQRKARLLMKSVRDLRSDGAKYDDLLRRSGSVPAQDGRSRAEKIKQVRALWSAIDEVLATTAEERQAVGSVLKGDVDQHALDGTGLALSVPRCLLDRVEQLPHQLSSGNVYEAGQLNVLCVMELTNQALRLLREERRQVAQAPQAGLSPRPLQQKRQQVTRARQSVRLIRQKISKEGIPEVRSAVRELEAEWDRKWSDVLGDAPLVSFLKEDSALGFLSPMAPLSFEPAAEASCGGSIFSRYPAALLAERPARREAQDGVPAGWSAPRSPSPVVAAEADTSLDWLFDMPPLPSVGGPTAPPKASVRKTSLAATKASPRRTTSQILDMECDNLADQFAEAVTTSSPPGGGGGDAGLDLERLLTTLHGDPFSTRKQLPRTPDSLILDVRSRWRKALEEDKTEKTWRSGDLNDSVIGRLTPLYESDPAASCSPRPFRNPPASQLGGSHRAPPLWDSIGAVDLHSPGGVSIGLDQETLPEVPSCYDLSEEEEEEERELLPPSPRSEAMQSPQRTSYLDLIRPACNDGSLIDVGKGTPRRLPADQRAPGPDRPTESGTDTDQVFSLDLDSLDTPSPTRTREYRLPALITFSPIDDLKF